MDLPQHPSGFCQQPVGGGIQIIHLALDEPLDMEQPAGSIRSQKMTFFVSKELTYRYFLFQKILAQYRLCFRMVDLTGSRVFHHIFAVGTGDEKCIGTSSNT